MNFKIKNYTKINNKVKTNKFLKTCRINLFNLLKDLMVNLSKRLLFRIISIYFNKVMFLNKFILIFYLLTKQLLLKCNLKIVNLIQVVIQL